MDWNLPFYLPFRALTDLQARLPRSLAWLLLPFILIALMIGFAWEYRGVMLRIAAPLLLSGLLGALLLKELPDTGDTAMLVLIGLAVWHVYQTESLRGRIERLENDLVRLKGLQRRCKTAA